MKNVMLKFGMVCLMFLSIACDKDSDELSESAATISTENATLEAKVDTNAEVVSDIVTQGFESVESTNKTLGYRFLPECAVVTVVYTDTTKEVTIDFGTEGCEGRNGHILKGKVVLSYAIDFETTAVVITYSFEDFFIDTTEIQGTKVATRTRGSETENPKYEMNLELTLLFANGTTATRIGTKTREWIEGIYNGNWGDNVFEITGAWQTTFADGTVHSTTIITPLRREASCKFLVSGTVKIQRTAFRGTLDYGEGACDNQATFTHSTGVEREILL